MSPPNPKPELPPNSEAEPEIETGEHQSLEIAEEKQKISRLAIGILVVRIFTAIFLLISFIILLSNTATFLNPFDFVVTVRFNSVGTYQYVVSAIAIGLVHTSSQVVTVIKHAAGNKKHLMNHQARPIISFFASQVVLCLLATAAGAVFAATVESKKILDGWDDALRSNGDSSLSESRRKLDIFFDVANISGSFLFLAFITAAVSSTLSAFSIFVKP